MVFLTTRTVLFQVVEAYLTGISFPTGSVSYNSFSWNVCKWEDSIPGGGGGGDHAGEVCTGSLGLFNIGYYFYICHSPFVGFFVLCACSAALGLFIRILEGSAFLFCLLL